MDADFWHHLRMRLFLAGAGVVRGMTLGVRVMLVEDDRILLIRHTYAPGWQMPGGGVEPGETSEDAAARELVEESGYRMLGRPALFGFYHNLNRSTRRDHVALYVCRAFEQDHVFRPTREIAEAGWFPRTALPPDITPGTRRRIDEVFDGRAPSPRW